MGSGGGGGKRMVGLLKGGSGLVGSGITQEFILGAYTK